MFCQKCGKQISDQAKFCNYCGAQVTNVRTQAAPRQQPVQQPVQQPNPPKKDKSAGRFIVGLLIVWAVYFGVQYVTEAFLTRPSSSSASSGSSTSSESSSSSGSSGTIALKDTSVLDTCTYGALYQDGYLTYGHARVRIPGYSLVAGEGNSNDMLVSADSTKVFYASKPFEVSISYDASDEAGILKSFSGDNGFSNPSIISFRKYDVGGYPVIRYIVKCTVGDVEEYVGELIVFPDKSPSQTLRLGMESLSESGYSEIDQIFDTLEISSEFELSYEDTQTMGINRITVK